MDAWQELIDRESRLFFEITPSTDSVNEARLQEWRETFIALQRTLSRDMPELTWKEICDRYYSVHDRSKSLAGSSDQNTPIATPELSRARWALVAALLKEYERRNSKHGLTEYADAAEEVSVPYYLAAGLAKLAENFGNGTIPSSIDALRKDGRGAHDPDELSVIRLAVAYHQACSDDGLFHEGRVIKVRDNHQTKTLTDWFDVDRRTVIGWVKKYPPAQLPHRAALPVFNAKKDDPTQPQSANMLIRLVRRAGETYRLMGRGRNAITARDSKRS